MTVDVTKDVSEAWADTELDIIGPDVTDDGDREEEDAGGRHRLLDIVPPWIQVATAATSTSPLSHEMTIWNKSVWLKHNVLELKLELA